MNKFFNKKEEKRKLVQQWHDAAKKQNEQKLKNKIDKFELKQQQY